MILNVIRFRSLGKRRRLLLGWSIAILIGGVAIAYLGVFLKPRLDPGRLSADGTVEGLTSVLDRTVTTGPAPFSFEDVREKSGIDFQHFPASRNSLLPEDYGFGAGLGGLR